MTDTLETVDANLNPATREVATTDTSSQKSNGACETEESNSVVNRLLDVPVELMVSVGKTQISIAELVNIERDRLLKLDTKIEDPVSILANGKPVAYGYLEEADDGGFQVRVSTLIENRDR